MDCWSHLLLPRRQIPVSSYGVSSWGWFDDTSDEEGYPDWGWSKILHGWKCNPFIKNFNISIDFGSGTSAQDELHSQGFKTG